MSRLPQLAVICLVLLALLVVAPAGATTVTLEGRYVPLHVDSAGTSAWLGDDDVHSLKVGDLYYTLVNAEALEDSVTPGSLIRVQGELSGSELTVETVEPLSEPTSDQADLSARSVLVVLVNWTSPDGVTQASAQAQVGDVDRTWYQQTSNGLFTLSATATPWLHIQNPGGCNYRNIQSAGEAAARGAGYNPDSYNQVMFYFPLTTACFWAGLGEVSGRYTWINGYMDLRVTTHELGHNFGLWHSNALSCSSEGHHVSLTSGCAAAIEYGDPVDVMGSGPDYSASGQFNAAQKDLLGWLSGKVDLTASGEYTLNPLELNVAAHAFRVVTPARTYYLEYRQPLFNDAFLSGRSYARSVDGVRLVLPHTGGASGSRLLDMRPQDDEADFLDAALPVGSCWRDPEGAFGLCTLSRVAGAGGFARISVTLGADDLAPAQFKAPAATLQATVAGLGSVPVKVDWQALDSSTVCAYTLQEQVAGGVWNPVALASATSRSVSRRQAYGRSYSYEETAEDCAGNSSAVTGATTTLRKYEERSRAVTYSGPWRRVALTGALGNRVRYATEAGASATFAVDSARSLALVATRGPGRGRARIYLDGVLKTTVDLKARRLRKRQIVYRANDLVSGAHELRVVAVGTRGRPRVEIDGFLRLAD